MTSGATPRKHQSALEPVDDMIDHVRGPAASPVIVEYGDYECPYSRQAYREIERVETELVGGVRFVFRHFPLTQTHPHALAAAAAAEAAARQGRFWDMHELLFNRQKALDEHDLQHYAADIGLDTAMFDDDRAGPLVLDRIRRDVNSGLASGEVLGTPALFINGAAHRGGYDAATLLKALAPRV